MAATGMRVSGELAYDLKFFVDRSCPDSLRFSSDLLRRDFRIRSFGSADLRKLDHGFLMNAIRESIATKERMFEVYLNIIEWGPKWFRSSFDSAGHLKAEMADYYRLVPDVELRGPAKEMLREIPQFLP